MMGLSGLRPDSTRYLILAAKLDSSREFSDGTA